MTLCDHLREKDAPDEVATANPHMYAEGIRRSCFNIRILAVWILSGAYHGAMAWLPPSLIFGDSGLEQMAERYTTEWRVDRGVASGQGGGE